MTDEPKREGDEPIASDPAAPVEVAPASETAAASELPPAELPPVDLPPVDLPPSPREAAVVDDVDDDEPYRPRRRRRGKLVAVTLALAVTAVAVLAVAGRTNSGRYRLLCTAHHIEPERGRSFPPWGMRAMGGDAWAPIPIPPAAECVTRTTDRREQLETWYLATISEQVLARLTPRDGGVVAGEDLDAAAALVEQGLLLTRAPARRDDRAELERLHGDVGYWRAFAKVEQAAISLEEAAHAFADAAARKPRNAPDAAAWAERAQRVAAELRTTAGTEPPAPVAAPAPGAPAAGARPVAEAPPTAGTTPTAPTAAEPGPPPEPGVALPVEAPPAAPLPDAGIPAGGVLL